LIIAPTVMLLLFIFARVAHRATPTFFFGQTIAGGRLTPLRRFTLIYHRCIFARVAHRAAPTLFFGQTIAGGHVGNDLRVVPKPAPTNMHHLISRATDIRPYDI
jgi:RsiW-degrading membrane proteinase PrsW (M82 family)